MLPFDFGAVHVLVGIAVVAILTVVFRKWAPGFGYGVLGLIFVVMPATFAYFRHGMDAASAGMTIVGTVIIVADASGKFRKAKNP